MQATPLDPTEGFQIEMAGNPTCPVCVDSGMVRVRFRGKWTWDACWLCADRAEAEYQISSAMREVGLA